MLHVNSLELGLQPGSTEKVETIYLTNSSGNITTVAFLQSRQVKMKGDIRRKEQEERKLKVTHSPSTYKLRDRTEVL